MVRSLGEDRGKRKVIADIAKCGWHCVHIHGEGDLVEYTFTVGLFLTYKHIELINN
jgi:Domain of unknown function (DUF4262)